jgi:hypothetical protein
MAELATPKPTPVQDIGVPSRKTPTTKPTVTNEQARRMRREGRECSKIKDVTTVKGSKRPRAT